MRSFLNGTRADDILDQCLLNESTTEEGSMETLSSSNDVGVSDMHVSLNGADDLIDGAVDVPLDQALSFEAFATGSAYFYEGM